MRVFVSDLCLFARHGVFPEEKRLGQKFFLDIDCRLIPGPGGIADDYARTLCYDGLCRLAAEVSDAGPFDLIETLAERIADAVLARHPSVASVRVEVRKPAAPLSAMVDHVGVEATRIRRWRMALSLGSNLGDKERNLRLALAHLAASDGVEIDGVSRLYRTAPWGKTDQDWFVNACATGWTVLEPVAMMKLCRRVELAVGRMPGLRWGPRLIDVDLLHMDDLRVETGELTLPHREMWNRAFVLEPLAEIAPELAITGRRVAEEADRVMRADPGAAPERMPSDMA